MSLFDNKVIDLVIEELKLVGIRVLDNLVIGNQPSNSQIADIFRGAIKANLVIKIGLMIVVTVFGFIAEK